MLIRSGIYAHVYLAFLILAGETHSPAWHKSAGVFFQLFRYEACFGSCERIFTHDNCTFWDPLESFIIHYFFWSHHPFFSSRPPVCCCLLGFSCPHHLPLKKKKISLNTHTGSHLCGSSLAINLLRSCWPGRTFFTHGLVYLKLRDGDRRRGLPLFIEKNRLVCHSNPSVLLLAKITERFFV